jgi:hypothetical protein
MSSRATHPDNCITRSTTPPIEATDSDQRARACLAP